MSNVDLWGTLGSFVTEDEDRTFRVSGWGPVRVESGEEVWTRPEGVKELGRFERGRSPTPHVCVARAVGL